MSRLPQSPSSEERSLRPGERGRARRRLRYLRQFRELQLRDLGGFVLDLYRFGQQRDRLVREKLDAIIATDKETHALESLLDRRRRTYEVRQPGVGGACPSCGDLHASNARFCARCGVDLREAAKEAEPAPEAEGGPTEEAPPAPALEDEPPAEAIRLEPGPAPGSGAAAPGPEEPGWPEPDPSPHPPEAVELDTVRRRRRRAQP